MLVSTKTKTLVLNLTSPESVLSLIPTAKALNYGGHDLVIVPHKHDEVSVLRNLGINAPSPIEYHYDYPGQFRPFDHQKTTAAFCTLHSKCLILNEIGCVDSETEYLSPHGWRRMDQYDGGEVAQYHPETETSSFVQPAEYVKKPCYEMIHIKTGYGVDQMLSPEHRVLYVSSTGTKMVNTAQQIFNRDTASDRGWAGRFITTFTPTHSGSIAFSDAQLRVQVAVIADGYFPTLNTSRCLLQLKKARKIERIKILLTEASIPFTERQSSKPGYRILRFDAPRRTKVFDSYFWQSSPHQLKVIADELVSWDGTIRKAGGSSFSTYMRESADFAQYAYVASGRTASLNVMTRDRRDKIETEYVVHARSGPALLYCKGWGLDGRLHNMNRVPSSDGYKYCFVVPSTFLVFRRNGCVFMSGNTGKTLSVLWAIDYLKRVGQASRTLIVSPLSTLERVWGDAIFSSFPRASFGVLHGSADKRKKLLEVDYDYYVINHDGIGVVYQELLHKNFDTIVVDEAAVLRNPSTKRFKLVRGLVSAKSVRRIWLLTGTPTPNEPTDAWALAKLLKPTEPMQAYHAFRDKVMMKVGMWKWVPRPEAADVVIQLLTPAIRFTRDECMDLPPTMVQTRHCDLTAEQRTAYGNMVRHLHTELKTGQISAVNEAGKMLKLVQIVCGVAYNSEGASILLDCHPRVALTKELIEEAGQKVIVFVPLTGTLRMLEQELSKHWSVAVVNGSVSPAKRNEIFTQFQNTKTPHVLVAHPGTMAHGLTLTEANTIIWYGPIPSNEQYVQACGRIERTGKKGTSHVIHIESTELERRIYERLQNKQRLQGLLLDMIENQKEFYGHASQV